MFTSAPKMEVVISMVVLTTLLLSLERILEMNLVASSTFMDSSGRVTPCPAAKSTRDPHQFWIWVI